MTLQNTELIRLFIHRTTNKGAQCTSVTDGFNICNDDVDEG